MFSYGSAPAFWPQATIRIAIADNQIPHCERLRETLAREPDFQVVGATGDSNTVVDLLRETDPDILLLELKSPQFDGHAILRQLQSTALKTRPIVWTACDDAEALIEALELGAKGIVVKQGASDQMTEAIWTVHQGRVWLDQHFMQVLNGGSIRPQMLDRGAAIRAFLFWDRLTERERGIVVLSLSRYRCKDIASKLSISVGTVRVHLHNIYSKLRVSDRRQVAGLY
jgi:DNA-binding NarL/FixJ family response regulator